MLLSMTGFGRAEQSVADKTFLVEMRSLNGKQFDLRLLIPALLKPYEFDIRNIISERLERGSVECVITLKQSGASKPVTINTELAKTYYQPVYDLATELNLNTGDILSTLLKLPEVITPSSETLKDNEWEEFKKVLSAAVSDLTDHRKDEGEMLEKDLILRINNIESQQDAISEIEPQRRIKIKDGLKKILEDNVGADSYDANRLEQELIYYIEKIDISEEQIRLKNHCDYFKTVLKESDNAKGKKLSFILQEIGREINTTGSKAYNSDIQKCVVLMKDELEKAKEQVLNVL
ncbi:YicC/YloC family endoribonuclease [Danxiaibacter flavus]|uniref:YicC/YloC family endoribonuclease n=1 Tax=Danxiaibacter flavus TaxID=3049108 RepID=A0ABV3ZET5_9BACT|nr:YicC/YloC family endoribonuclease [Chitinophagaceae bacterium DXS]